MNLCQDTCLAWRLPSPESMPARPTPTSIPCAIPLPTPTPFAAHHQWGNLWNAILTFSKVSFIAYMRHLCARASVSAAVAASAATRDAARWHSHYAVVAPNGTTSGGGGLPFRLPLHLSLPSAFDWKSCCSCLFLFAFPLPLAVLGAHVCAIKGVVMCALIIIIRWVVAALIKFN